MKQLDSEQQRVMRYAFHMNDPLNQLDKALDAAGAALLERQNERLTRWVEFVERREDMSPDGILRVQRQSDGDVVITILSSDRKNGFGIASVEFCGPMTGGGSSENTWKALLQLAAAMDDDNKQRPQTLATRPVPAEGAKAGRSRANGWRDI